MPHLCAEAPFEWRIDLYGRAPRALRQIHLWITLVAGLPLVVLGETPHSVAQTIAAVRARVGEAFTPFLHEAPAAPEQPATLRLMEFGDAVKGRLVVGVLVDSLSILSPGVMKPSRASSV